MLREKFPSFARFFFVEQFINEVVFTDNAFDSHNGRNVNNRSIQFELIQLCLCGKVSRRINCGDCQKVDYIFGFLCIVNHSWATKISRENHERYRFFRGPVFSLSNLPFDQATHYTV